MVSAEILTIQLLDLIFLVFGAIAFYHAVKIYQKWDINSTTPAQYRLEKLSFLNQTIIKYIFAIKLPLFLFFIFTIDKISDVLTGAMCGVGVINATEVGLPLFVLKLINIYLFGFWLVINKKDLKDPNLSLTKKKFGFFIPLFLLLCLEIGLEFFMFGSLNPDKLVSCCGTVFSSTATSSISAIFKIKTSVMIGLFYSVFIMMVLFYKNTLTFRVTNILYLFISLLSLIQFFSTYVYELPTHHCPFCLLQKDYYYVGYLFYTSLFLGTFYGVVGKKKLSLVFNTIYLLSVSAYPVIFYIKNKVWL